MKETYFWSAGPGGEGRAVGSFRADDLAAAIERVENEKAQGDDWTICAARTVRRFGKHPVAQAGQVLASSIARGNEAEDAPAAGPSYPLCEACGAVTHWPTGDCLQCGRVAPD